MPSRVFSDSERMACTRSLSRRCGIRTNDPYGQMDDPAMREKMMHLANLAYERELQRELGRVQRHIDLYRDKESKFFNLNEIKFKFYRETSDQIWRLYERLAPDKAIGRAVALGLLTDEDLPEDVRNTLQHAV